MIKINTQQFISVISKAIKFLSATAEREIESTLQINMINDKLQVYATNGHIALKGIVDIINPYEANNNIDSHVVKDGISIHVTVIKNMLKDLKKATTTKIFKGAKTKTLKKDLEYINLQFLSSVFSILDNDLYPVMDGVRYRFDVQLSSVPIERIEEFFIDARECNAPVLAFDCKGFLNEIKTFIVTLEKDAPMTLRSNDSEILSLEYKSPVTAENWSHNAGGKQGDILEASLTCHNMIASYIEDKLTLNFTYLINCLKCLEQGQVTITQLEENNPLHLVSDSSNTELILMPTR